MRPDALIIGGGVAGLRCARELSRQGVSSIIAEKAPTLGGHVRHYACKATKTCQRCGACLLEDLLAEVRQAEEVTCLTRTDVLRAETRDGGFRLELLRRPARIHPDRCDGCGKCIEVCPVPGALERSAAHGTIALAEETCRHFREGSCQACADACPCNAFDFQATPEDVVVEARAVVLACGFKAFDAADKPRFGYGRVPGVITGLELESMLRDDNFSGPAGDREIRSVAFIQCVGSRDPKLGRNYCSRVCCGYALRTARLLRSRFVGVEPSMFYMDMQSFDRDFERRISEARREVRLIRSIPAEVRLGADGRPEVIYHGPADARIMESFDLVVLSVGMSPDTSLAGLAEIIGVGSNEDGFLGMGGDEVLTNRPGVFTAGAVQGPRSITETVSHAIRAAAQVIEHLKQSDSGDGR